MTNDLLLKDSLKLQEEADHAVQKVLENANLVGTDLLRNLMTQACLRGITIGLTKAQEIYRK